MGKRIAEKQLTQLNQDEDDMDESTEHYGGGFHMAAKEKMSQRVIKKPRSRLRGAASTATTSASGGQSNTPSSGAFSGFSGFRSPASMTAASDNASANVTPTPATTSADNAGGSDSASKGLFKGFSFAQTPTSVAAKVTATPVPAFGAVGSFGSNNSAGSVSTVFGAGSFGPNSAASAKPTASFASPFGSKATTAAGDDTGSAPKKNPFSFGATNPTASMDIDSKPAGGFSMPAFKPPTLGASTSSGSSMFSESQKQSSSFSNPFAPSKQADTTKAPATATGPAVTATAAGSSTPSEEEFYRNIRGLNVSLQKKISDAVSANAFVDLTPLLDQYANHWNLITKKQSAGSTSNTAAAKSGIVDNKESGIKPAVTATFTPTASISSAPSPFAFLQPAAKDSGKPLSPTAVKETRSTSIADTVDTTAMEASPKPPPVSTPFKFGATNTSGGAKSNFSFSFGKPPLPQQPSPSASSNSDAAKKPFSFGFLQQAGSPTRTADTSVAPETKPVFTFGFGSTNNSVGEEHEANLNNSAGMNGGNNNNNKDDDAEEEEEESSAAKKPSTAGEEGEATEHQVRAKVYVWDGTESKYKDMGVGQLKVNTWETSDSQTNRRARVLCRQEGSNKITLNASLFKEMIVEYTQGKKELGFLVIVNGKPTRYLIRTSSSDTTATLHECIERVKLSL